MQDQPLLPEMVQHLHVLGTELLQPAFNFKIETEASSGTTVPCEDETPKHTHVQHTLRDMTVCAQAQTEKQSL